MLAPARKKTLAAGLLMLAAALLWLPAASHGQGGAPRRAVTAREMSTAGLTRLTGLFDLLDTWEASSVDGYAFRAAPVGLSPYNGFAIAVDGQPVETGVFGVPALSLLPVHPSQLDSVVAVGGPRIVDGQLAAEGALRFYTRRSSAAGFRALGAASAGNEVGDPGPFRSTPNGAAVTDSLFDALFGTSPEKLNVDRIGPQYFGAVTYGAPGSAAGSTRVQLSLKANQHFATDVRIRPRLNRYYDEDTDGAPLLRLTAPRLHLETRGRYGRHALSAHYARLRDFYFLPTLGYELPALQQQAFAGLNGALPPPAPSAGRLRYRLGYHRATLAYEEDRGHPSNPASLALDWQQERARANLEWDRAVVRIADAPLTATAGLSSTYVHARAGMPLGDPSLLTTRAYAQLALRRAPLRPRLTLALSQTDGTLGGAAMLSSTLRPAPRQTLGLRLAYLRRPYAEAGTLWYWIGQGLDAPQAEEGALTLPGAFPPSQRLSAAARWRGPLPGGGRFALEAGLRHFRDLTLPASDFRYDAEHGGLMPTIRLRNDAAGQTFRAAATLRRAWPSSLAHRLRYDFFTHRADDERAGRDAFEQRWERVPRHRLRYTARLSVGERFSLEGDLAYRSPARWSAFRRAAEGSRYQAPLPAYWILNATATKRLWGDHLNLRLSLRNLLNEPVRTHPAGPVTHMALFLSLEAAF